MKLTTTQGLRSKTVLSQEVGIDRFLSFFNHDDGFFKGVYKSEDCQRMLLVEYHDVVDGVSHPRKGLKPKLIYGLIIEYDDGIPTLSSRINSGDSYTRVIYTSPSHQQVKNGKPPCDRFREVIIFNKPCPLSEFNKRIESFTSTFKGLDPSCLRLSQFQRVPMYCKGYPNPEITIIKKDNLFDWESLPVTSVVNPPKLSKSIVTTGSVSEYLPIETGSGLMNKQDLIDHFNASDTLISNVRCPTHVDKKPGCFIGISKGIPFVGCHKCGRIPLWEHHDDDSAIIQKVKQSKKNKPPKSPVGITPTPSHDELMEIDEPFVQPLTLDEIKDGLGEISKKLTNRNLIFSREGTGKSYITKVLLDSGYKVLFTTSSNSQSDEKFQEFLTFGYPSIRLTSVTHSLKTKYGVEPINLKPKHPWDLGGLNKDATAQEVVNNHPELTFETVINDIELFDRQSRLRWGDTQLVVTTHAMLILLQQQNQKLMDEGKSPIIPPDVIIIVDDPNRQDFYPFKIWSYDFARSFVNNHYVKSKTFESKSGHQRRYFVKPQELSFGYGLPNNKVIFTTTELVTGELIKQHYENLTEHDELNSDLPIFGGDLHLLSTPWVWEKYDGLLPVIMERVGRVVNNMVYISDGQGAQYNHVNNKGVNSLKTSNTVIELSKLNPKEVQEVLDNLSFYEPDEWKSSDNKGFIETMITVDKLNQSVGRNSGQRYNGLSCVVLIDPQLYLNVLKFKYYHFNSEIIVKDVLPSQQPESDSLLDQVIYYLVNYNRFYSQRNYLMDDVKRCLKSGHKDKFNQRKQRLHKVLDTFTEMNLNNKINRGGLKVSIKQEKLDSIKSLLKE